MALDGFETLARMLAEALLNGLWQGMLLTALIWLGLRATPRTAAATRFGIWSATLAAVLAIPTVRLAFTSVETSPAAALPAPIHLSAGWPMVMLAVWAVIAALLLGRLAWSYGYVRWLARTSTRLDSCWQERSGRLTGSDRVRVRGSRETPVPVVIGLRRPVILIPQRLLARLEPEELDQV